MMRFAYIFKFHICR